MARIFFNEVVARDGFQNEPETISTDDKVSDASPSTRASKTARWRAPPRRSSCITTHSGSSKLKRSGVTRTRVGSCLAISTWQTPTP